MTTSELDQVQALIDNVVPDPTRFAQRLVTQFVTQWGAVTEPGAATVDTTAWDGHVEASRTFERTARSAQDEALVKTNGLLAAALGACACWGFDTDCPLCRGQGCTGWTQPDRELFEEFVAPAIARLPGSALRPSGSGGEISNEEGPRQSARKW